MPRSGVRYQLLAAGDRLGRADPGRLTAAAVAKAAGTTPAALKREFGSLRGFHAELMFFWLDQMRDAVAHALAGASGPDRVVAAMTAYLDANLARRTLRHWMPALRADPATAERAAERIRGFTFILQTELRDLGWLRAPAAGRLYAAMAIETAQAEYEAGARRDDLRATFIASLRRG